MRRNKTIRKSNASAYAFYGILVATLPSIIREARFFYVEIQKAKANRLKSSIDD